MSQREMTCLVRYTHCAEFALVVVARGVDKHASPKAVYFDRFRHGVGGCAGHIAHNADLLTHQKVD